jgi:hypothetical protein
MDGNFCGKFSDLKDFFGDGRLADENGIKGSNKIFPLTNV